jgi:hypothetical protein
MLTSGADAGGVDEGDIAEIDAQCAGERPQFAFTSPAKAARGRQVDIAGAVGKDTPLVTSGSSRGA